MRSALPKETRNGLLDAPGITLLRRSRTIFITALLLCVASLSFGLPAWVNSYGTDTPYAFEDYYTGFGMAQRSGDDASALDAAKAQAKADLITKIEVQVSSSIVSSESNDGDRSISEATAVSESFSALDIENVEYDVDNNRTSLFALARVDRTVLADSYRNELESLLAQIASIRRAAEESESAGDNASSLKSYASLSPLLQNAYRISELLGTIVRGTALESRAGTTSASGLSETELPVLGTEIDDALSRLRYGDSSDLDTAMELMIAQLADQEVPPGIFQVANLTYEDSDYSSAFGSYAAGAVQAALTRSLGGGRITRVVRGTYWIVDEIIELRLLIQLPSGKIVGSSALRIPQSSIPESVILKPRNFEQALVDQHEIAEGAIVDGGIAIEVWTNQGRNADRLVFSEGDIIQFYFRTNQPCFLQLTYILATGEKVLLDESYYLGQDKVNLVVRYPVEFEPIAPFGVERMVATAFEQAPPKPNVTIQEIDGYSYQVFTSTDAMYSATRGIRPRSQSEPQREIRVGEAVLTITTAAAIAGE